KDKHDSYKKRKKPKPKKKKGAKDTISAALKAAWKFVKNVYESEVKKFFLCLAIPVIVILLVFGIITMLFSATSSHSGFTLGTYAAQDYDLSEAEKYYTELAYNLNQKIRKVGSSADWQSGLAAFGANTGDLSDTPDEWVWGRSSIYDFDPVYDFDTYKLWSFLCAYYYDFDADNDDIYYWEFDGDTEDLLEEIFNDEYEFVYWYDNQSRWEELSPYNYWGGGNASSGTYYRAEQDAYIYDGQPYKYRFKPIAITSELSQYEDDDGYLCITDGYRVLDPNDDYRETGFFIMDHRWYSGTSHPFYYIDNDTDTFFFMKGSTRHNRSFWGWDGTDAWFLVSPTDTHIWNSSLNDVCMYGYYEKYKWKTECKLYYNVKQNKTFDEVIADKLSSMSHSDERLQYYALLVGAEDSATMYGNHQTLHNLLPGATVRDYDLKREFGYEMTGWNTDSDGLYQGIKVYCNNGDKLKAPFKGEITDVNTDDNKITIRKDDVEYWYDGSGGTERDTEVTIANAVLLSGFSEGDTVNDGQEFAKTTAGNVNFHIYIDTDGYGWDYIDPRLVLY
ncbi:MAG: copper-binding protein, partial [Ruminococcus sp.]|nr:copper-binding protein [Ruminococcus sp.]